MFGWFKRKDTTENRSSGSGYTAQIIAARASYIAGSSGIGELTATVQACVSLWEGAFALADVTVNGVEYLKRNRDALEAHLASLTDHERGELRQHMVASMTQIMRDCPNDDTRACAYEVLQKLKVI